MPSYTELLDAIDTLRRIVTLDVRDDARRRGFRERLKTLEHRARESCVYIGIVGEFSSGKSTLINTLIGADYFVTNAIQGTTTVTTLIRYASSINLEMKYKDGRVIDYNTGKTELLRKYLPDEYRKLGLLDKASLHLLSIVGANEKHDLFHKLFDCVTTSDEVAREVDEVTVYYPSPMLQRGIVIVDTPGTDSSNPEHTRIAERAIAEKCDVSMVMVPAEKPMSQTLSDFVARNFPQNKAGCYFLVTKAELLRSDRDRAFLLKGVRARISKFLDIEQPKLILAPTLLSLEVKELITPTGLFKHLSEESKKTLVKEFHSGMADILAAIEKNKAVTVHQTLRKNLIPLCEDLRREIAEEVTWHENTLRHYADNPIHPLNIFVNNCLEQAELKQAKERAASFLKQHAQNQAKNLCDALSAAIDGATSVSDVRDIAKSSTVENEGAKLFKECFMYFKRTAIDLSEYYQKCFQWVQSRVNEEYGFAPDAISFEYDMRIKPSWAIPYRFRFDSSGMSNFISAYLLHNLRDNKKEMRRIVPPQIQGYFENLSRKYEERLLQLHAKLEQSFQKSLSKLLARYSSRAEQTVAQRRESVRALEEKLMKLKLSNKLLKRNVFK